VTREETLAAADDWFLHHGLSYFVPECRADVRNALRLRRTVPLVLVVALLAAGAGAALAWWSGEFSAAPATLVALGGLALAWYALTALHARPIVTWALARTFASLRRVLPNTTRALPLLLLAITFLFINTEMWQVGSTITVGTLWLIVVLFALLAIAFLLVRLPEEVDSADDDVDDVFLLRACAGTPLEEPCRELVESSDTRPAAYAEVTGYERWNLIIVLLVVQLAQVIVLSASVFVFLMVFGWLTMTDPVMEAWLLPQSVPASAALVQVSVFLASFSGLYLTVYTVTDEAYRVQFFGGVTRELERAVGVRAVYLALRAPGRDAESAP
jgi:hypothetical protein